MFFILLQTVKSNFPLLVGPFPTHQSATHYAHTHYVGSSWHLLSPMEPSL